MTYKDEPERNKVPAFQFYPKDWLEHKVTRMSDAAQGIYIRLLCIIWTGTKTQFSIQNDDKSLAKSLGISKIKWKKYKQEIQHKDDPILLEQDGMLISARLRKERKKQELWREESRKGGQKSAELRLKQEATNAQATPQPKFNSSSSSSSSTAVNKDNTKWANELFEKAFDEAWKRYPRKLGKRAAQRHFNATVKTETDLLQFKQALNTFLASDASRQGQYTPHGSTWFNNWQDWIDNPDRDLIAKDNGSNGPKIVYDKDGNKWVDGIIQRDRSNEPKDVV